MRINERFFKLRRSAARSSVKPHYGNEDSGMSVMSETCVREEKIIKILSSAFCLKKTLKLKIVKARILEKKKRVHFWFD